MTRRPAGARVRRVDPVDVADPIPTFTIDARDPLAAGVVMMWACFRNGDLVGALAEFNDLAQSEAAREFEETPDEHNAARAVELSEAMEEWALSKD